MSQPSAQERRSAEIIEEARRTIESANKALAKADQFFRDHRAQIDLVRRQMTPAMEEHVQREIANIMRDVERQSQEALLHKQFQRTAAVQPRRTRSLV